VDALDGPRAAALLDLEAEVDAEDGLGEGDES